MFHYCVNGIYNNMEYVIIISKVCWQKKVMNLEKISDHV